MAVSRMQVELPGHAGKRLHPGNLSPRKMNIFWGNRLSNKMFACMFLPEG